MYSSPFFCGWPEGRSTKIGPCSSDALKKVWLYNLAADPTERHDLSTSQPEKLKAMQTLLAQQDAGMAKPLWPSLLQGPIFVDHPSGQPQKKGEEYIVWDN